MDNTGTHTLQIGELQKCKKKKKKTENADSAGKRDPLTLELASVFERLEVSRHIAYVVGLNFQCCGLAL